MSSINQYARADFSAAMGVLVCKMRTTGSNNDEVAAIAAIFRALSHPIRIRVLVAFPESSLSPAELDRLLADPAVSLSALSYHVRGLARTGLIELTAVRQRRNAIEHRYTLTARGRTVVRALEALELPGEPADQSRD